MRLRTTCVNMGIVLLVTVPAVLVTIGFQALGDDMPRAPYIDTANIYLGVVEVEQVDVEPRYAKKTELFWVEASDIQTAKKVLARGLAAQWGERIRTHRVINVLSKQDWGQHGIGYIEDKSGKKYAQRAAKR